MAAQLWAVAADGGFMYADRLSEVLRMELLSTVKFRQFCDAKDEVGNGRNKGDTWYWNVYSKVETKGRTLQETDRMPETKFTIQQRSAALDEWGKNIAPTLH